jgi:c-di-GMP-binding flagellar brake protein YcgR
MVSGGDFPRMNIRAPVRLEAVLVSPGDRDDSIVEAEVIDLSAGGAGVLCATYLSRSRRLTLGLSLDDGSVLALPSTVASRDRTADRRWRYGLRFLDVDDAQRGALTRQVMRALAAAFEDQRS